MGWKVYLPESQAGSCYQKGLLRWAEQHEDFPSENNREMLEQIDVLLQEGRRISSRLIFVESHTKALSAEERQNMILDKINELLTDQLTELNDLRTALSTATKTPADTDGETCLSGRSFPSDE